MNFGKWISSIDFVFVVVSIAPLNFIKCFLAKMIHDGALILNQEFLGHKRALTKIKVPLKKTNENEEKWRKKQEQTILLNSVAVIVCHCFANAVGVDKKFLYKMCYNEWKFIFENTHNKIIIIQKLIHNISSSRHTKQYITHRYAHKYWRIKIKK